MKRLKNPTADAVGPKCYLHRCPALRRVDRGKGRIAVVSDSIGENQSLRNDEACMGALPGTPENPLHTLKTVPNLITLFRLVFTIAFLYLYLCTENTTVAVVLFILAASTDWIDGQVARRFRQVSVFGKRFDPIMDRVLIFSGVLALLLSGRLPLWVVVFLIARDGVLLIGSVFLKLTINKVIDVCYVGKACTFVLMTGFAILLFDLFVVPGLGLWDLAWLPGFGAAPASLGIWLVYIGCLLSLAAACIYIFRGVRAYLVNRKN